MASPFVCLNTDGCYQEILLELGASLAQFKALKYLTFMAAGAPTSFSDERSIAEAWSKACPTLRTVILPKGLVWFRTDENWACLRDSEE
jgi:hypothetical protein